VSSIRHESIDREAIAVLQLVEAGRHPQRGGQRALARRDERAVVFAAVALEGDAKVAGWTRAGIVSTPATRR
jgi:hypothetical protein